MSRLILLIISALLLGSAIACQSPDADSATAQDTPPPPPVEERSAADTTYQARGVVRSVTPSGSYLRIQHGDIPGFMDAMTMAFAVADSISVDDVARGDSIAFAFVAGTAGVTIQSVEKIER